MTTSEDSERPDEAPSPDPPRQATKTADTAGHDTAGQDIGAPSGRGVIRRPLEMYLGAVFLTVAALPLIGVGVALAVQLGALGTNLRQKITEAQSVVPVDTLVTGLRVAGAVLLLGGVLFAALAWLAVRPRKRARSAVTALAALEMALLVFAMIVTAVDPVSLGITLLAGAGVGLLYLPRSEEFLLARR